VLETKALSRNDDPVRSCVPHCTGDAELIFQQRSKSERSCYDITFAQRCV
jgi:hypothetical protein